MSGRPDVIVFLNLRTRPYVDVISSTRRPRPRRCPSAMLRTWPSDSRHHIPVVGQILPDRRRASPRLPPSFPSYPLRGDAGHLQGEELIWSTCVIVFFSSRISPFTSTVIFLECPRGHDRVHLGDVRPAREVGAMAFTLSVRSSRCGDALIPAAQLALVPDLAATGSPRRPKVGECRIRFRLAIGGTRPKRLAVDLDRSSTAPGRPWRPALLTRDFGGRLDHVAISSRDRRMADSPRAGRGLPGALRSCPLAET